MIPPDLQAILAIGLETAKIAVRAKLEEVDRHPLGHFACELIRAKARGELDTADDILVVLRQTAHKPR